MPLNKKAKKILKNMTKQYCRGKTDSVVDGIRTCKVAKRVFYAYVNKHNIDYTLSKDELLDLAVDYVEVTDKKE